MIRIRHSIVLPILVSASFVVASHATANPPIDVRTQPVGYGDLNLATPQGVATLDRRLRSAIHEVCSQPSPRTIASFSAQRRCYREAWAGINLQRAEAIAFASTRTQLAARGQ